MLERLRRQYARRVRELVVGNLPKRAPLPRKQAIFQVCQELRAAGFPGSRRTLYRWMAEFGVSLQ